MALGRRRERQQELWVPTAAVHQSVAHPFYRRLNAVLAAHGFDAFMEELFRPFYSEGIGRPGIPPGVYGRMLLIGYFEGLDSEREIAWRCADSLALRDFLGLGLGERTPDHSTISGIRRKVSLEAHQQVFHWVLSMLAKGKLLKGRRLGVDATTLEANAAMRSIVRRDSGEGYQEFLVGLARSSGIATPTREDLARIDRHRPGKGSNEEWESPSDGDARIAKMKDGRTHLAHKAEHAVDLDSGAVMAVTIQPADTGDTQSLDRTLCAAVDTMQALKQRGVPTREMLQAVVADRGYHSNDVLLAVQEMTLRSYIAEPHRGRRSWKGRSEARRAVYANRRRCRSARGVRLRRLRAERVERSFAHLYETGGLRRVHLRGHRNILKRLLLHVAGFNLGLLMRHRFGLGTPRGVRRLFAALLELLRVPLERLCGLPVDSEPVRPSSPGPLLSRSS